MKAFYWGIALSLSVIIFLILFIEAPTQGAAIYNLSKKSKQIVRNPPASILKKTRCKENKSIEANYLDKENYSIQMIYMYPKNGVNRFKKVSNSIQRDAQFMDWLYLQQSKKKRSIAWDTEGECGERYLDIRTMRSNKPIKWYKNHQTYAFIDQAGAQLHQLLAAEQADPDISQEYKDNSKYKLYLIYMDQTSYRNTYGPNYMAYNQSDNSPGLENKGIYANSYGVIIGDSKRDLFKSNLYQLMLRRHAVAHEITHMLGAVDPSAPHGRTDGHCYDGYDLMCNNFGEGEFGFGQRCKGWTFRIDCGRDDYFSLNPKPGSFLAKHWNIANSPFLRGSKLRKQALEKENQKLQAATVPRLAKNFFADFKY
jgi:hypothetical protein